MHKKEKNNMATKWRYDFFTDTSNAMSIEERINETVINMGKNGIIFPDGECCKTEEELRSLLVKKGFLKDVSKGGWVVNKITTMAILFLLTLFCGACGSKGNATDAEVKQFKVWHYSNMTDAYVAGLHSTNYYSTDKDENVYLNITLRSSEYGVIGGFDLFVYGTPQNETGTVVKFLQDADNCIITFDNEAGEVWRGASSSSGLTYQILRIEDFIEKLKVSNTCTVMLETTMGQMTYNFDTRNLQWN